MASPLCALVPAKGGGGAWTSTLLERKGGVPVPLSPELSAISEGLAGKVGLHGSQAGSAVSGPTAAAGGGPVRTLTPGRDKATCPVGSVEAMWGAVVKASSSQPGGISRGQGEPELRSFLSNTEGPSPKPGVHRGSGEPRLPPVLSSGSLSLPRGLTWSLKVPASCHSSPPAPPLSLPQDHKWVELPAKGHRELQRFKPHEKDPTECM